MGIYRSNTIFHLSDLLAWSVPWCSSYYFPCSQYIQRGIKSHTETGHASTPISSPKLITAIYCFTSIKLVQVAHLKKKMIRIKAAGADLSCFLVLHLGRAPKMLDLFSPAWCPGLSYSMPQFASRLSVIAEVALMSSPGLFCQTLQSRRKHHTSMSTG